MINPLTPAGIEPATFRFVAQHLNHCATPPKRGHFRKYIRNTLEVLNVVLEKDGAVLFILVILRRLNSICRRFGTLCSIFIGGIRRKNTKTIPTNTAYEDETECSETSAYKIQTPENHPK